MKDFQKLLAVKEQTIKQSMEQIDKTSGKVLFIVNDAGQLTGALSDGDIRRAILQGKSLETTIESVMNSNPKFIYEKDINNKRKIKSLLIGVNSSIPVVDQKLKIIDILFWQDFYEGAGQYAKKENKVFILAGGVGSRLEPFTRILPKPLIPLGNKPMLEKIMDKFQQYGFDEFVLSLNYKAEVIKLYFNDIEVKGKYSDIKYVQENEPLGTIGSLYLAKDLINDSFFITNSDIIIEGDIDKIFSFHREQKNILTIVGCVKNSVIPYGVLATDGKGYLTGIEEKPSYKHVINTGVYVAEPEIISFIEPSSRLDINVLIEKLIKQGEKISIYPIFEEQWFDVGQWVEYERTVKYFENA